MIGKTLPHVSATIRAHKRTLLLLALSSSLLGISPVLQSELVSGLIDAFNKILRQPINPYETFLDILRMPLHRFDSPDYSGNDLARKLAYYVFSGITFGWALLFFLIITLASSAIAFGASYFRSAIKRQVFVSLRGKAMRKGLETDPAQLPSLTNAAGQYASAIQQGAINVTNTYAGLLQALQTATSLATTIWLVATKSLEFGAGCLILVMGQVIISVAQARRLKDRREQLDRTRNELLARTDDILSKREILLAYEQDANYGEKLDVTSRSYADVERNLDVGEAWFDFFTSLLTSYGQVIVLAIAVFVAIALGDRGVSTIGDAYFILAIYAGMSSSARSLLVQYDSIRRSEATSKTFLYVIAGCPSSAATPAPVSESNREWLDSGNAIEFKTVCFAYPSDRKRKILMNTTFHAPLNKTTLVVGKSGCGKTTIGRILLGFWPIESGSVAVLGRDLGEYSGRQLRDKMSYLAQADYIVDDSVRENLLWAHSGNGAPPSDSEMLDVLRSLGVVTDVMDPSILGKVARDLSIGQQQRLSLARLLLDTSEISVLDEPLAGVDVFTFAELLPKFADVLRSGTRSSIIFSHRLTYASLADHVIVLGDQGEVLEQGYPPYLLNSGGVFCSLYRAALSELSLRDSLSATIAQSCSHSEGRDAAAAQPPREPDPLRREEGDNEKELP